MRLDAVVAPAKAGLLVAAERGGDITLAIAVHRDRAGANGPRRPQRARRMRCKNRCRQPVIAVIGDGDGLVQALHRDHRQHRPEDFLFRQAVVGVHPVKDGRGDVIALDRAAGKRCHPLAGIGKIAADLGAMLAVDQASQIVRRIQRVAHPPVAHPRQYLRHELLAHILMDNQPRGGGTILAHVPEGAIHQMFGDQVKILGVIHDDGRVLAATFQNHLLQIGIRRIAKKAPPGLGRSGEGHHIDPRVKANRLAGIGAGAGDDVQHATRDSRLHRQFGNTKRRQRRLLGRLDHHRAAGGQRRTDLPGQHQQREIPRQHRADNADRLAHDKRHRVLADRGRLVIELVDGLGMPDQRVDGLGNIDGGAITNRLAGIDRFQDRQLVPVAADQLGKPDQHRLALGRMKAAPAPVIKSLARLADGEIDIFLIAGRHLRQQRPGGRVDAVEGLAAGGLAKTAIDKGCRGQREPVGDGLVFLVDQQF